MIFFLKKRKEIRTPDGTVECSFNCHLPWHPKQALRAKTGEQCTMLQLERKKETIAFINPEVTFDGHFRGSSLRSINTDNAPTKYVHIFLKIRKLTEHEFTYYLRNAQCTLVSGKYSIIFNSAEVGRFT